MKPERRQAPRVEERVWLALRGATTDLRAETKNLSTIGAYCVLDRFLAPMTKLRVEFELPDGARRVRIRGEGAVVRVEPIIDSAERGRYHVGIFFTEMSDENRAAISRFVVHRLAARSSSA
ncbi:MAG: PilZ domain-containing protein [Candidatus Omnitrophica bacterium]|nr:PilZ domain-containing protein [Candidatus Omnitrophota bacterium]